MERSIIEASPSALSTTSFSKRFLIQDRRLRRAAQGGSGSLRTGVTYVRQARYAHAFPGLQGASARTVAEPRQVARSAVRMEGRPAPMPAETASRCADGASDGYDTAQPPTTRNCAEAGAGAVTTLQLRSFRTDGP
jgi:hypothetical protein